MAKPISNGRTRSDIRAYINPREVIVAAAALVSMGVTVVTAVHYMGAIETRQAVSEAVTAEIIKGNEAQAKLRIDEIKSLIKRLDEDRRQDVATFQQRIQAQDAEIRQIIIGRTLNGREKK